MTDHTENSEPEASDSLKAFGEVVKSFREHAGLTREELGARVCCSRHTVASIELGRRFPPPHFAEKADEALHAFGTLAKAARHLSRNPGLAAWVRLWARLERDALSLDTYECRVVPGLLQSEAYARTVFHSRVPPLEDEQIEAQVVARLDRQSLLCEKPNTGFSFIIEESVFQRCSGGVEVARGVVDRVLECATLRNVAVQLMPLRREDHAGLEGAVQLLESPDNRWFGYCEGQRGGQFFSDPKEVSVLRMRYAKLRSQALTPEDSVSLLERIRGDL
ncbi:helix-turn-helix transcriptional regulator [Streptomyces sp. JJ36]|uniref:helix-turn-helix domain-containing protein n=1 Tax=Streptomyces sp. JJ36 TaxID=2736645 RepID=UPI001F2F71D7|nr:helix-turn-helix transcriptional regulator [Streptomyces sp. JJ36]MCF6521537.1 helix-turn-helix transcriptional regulator [Streptomyces sp. JJ36]